MATTVATAASFTVALRGGRHIVRGGPMRNRWRARFGVELALGLVSAALLALTLVAPDWLEGLVGAAPDAGDGAVEWAFSLGSAAVAVLMFGLAGRTWTTRLRRLRPA